MFIVPGDFACLAPRASANIMVAGAHGGEEHPNSLAVRQRQGKHWQSLGFLPFLVCTLWPSAIQSMWILVPQLIFYGSTLTYTARRMHPQVLP